MLDALSGVSEARRPQGGYFGFGTSGAAAIGSESLVAAGAEACSVDISPVVSVFVSLFVSTSGSMVSSQLSATKIKTSEIASHAAAVARTMSQLM